ncbi:diguanylate cyclase [Chitinibacter sp. S2-10]|uniref:diguanylate cyclase n=1 Tax=Chitinibacter sp. S2-10 TaxID=3373597 RepID=UPI0039774679
MPWKKNRTTYSVILAALLGLGMVFLLAYQIANSYQAAHANARLANETALKRLNEQIGSKTREIELVLQSLSDLLVATRATDADPQQIQQQLNAKLSLLPQIDNIGILNPSGVLLAQAHAEPDLTLQQDFLSLLNQAKNTSGLIYHEQQSPQHAVIIGFKPRDLLNENLLISRLSPSFIKQHLSSDDSAQQRYLIDRKLNILARYPANAPSLEISAELSKQFGSATHWSQILTDRSQLISFQRVGNSPLYLVSAESTDNYLLSWKRSIFYYVVAASLLLMLILLMSYYFWRSQRLARNIKAKELKLSASEARFRQMIETMPVGLILARMPDFFITYINQHAARMLGIPQASALSKRAHDYYYEKIDFFQHSDEALTGKTVNDAECMLKHRHGNPFWANISMSAVSSQEGCTLVIGLNDITQRKQLEQELKHRATTDSLSGLNNRAYFMEAAQQEIQRCKRYQHRACILMLDIDFFKKINDTYGHQTGDDVIKTMANLCKASLRDVDLLARIGGEEFTVFMPETPLADAYRAAERLRLQIENYVLHLEDGQTIKFTCSMGLSELRQGDASIDEPLKRADEALYASKHRGRNRVTCFEQLKQADSSPKTP